MLVFGLAAAHVHGQSGLGLPRWVQREIIDRITITGNRRLSYHDHKVTGDQGAFNFGNYFGQGDKKITDHGTIRINGFQVLGAINFDFTITDSRFRDPQGQKFTLDYDRGPWEIELGDVRGRLLNTNPFARFNKSLRGTTIGYRAGRFQMRVVNSEVRGAAKTVTIRGTNSAGPYFLQSTQIVRGSEIIEVDGVRQVLGTDYEIEYERGAITFVNRRTGQSKIIPPTSVIVATYEVFGFSGQRGTVQGASATYVVLPNLRLGMTAIRQITGATGRLSTRLEKFFGFGPPSTPYFLQFEPLATEPIVVTVDGIRQIEGIDYFFDPDNPSIFFFTRFMAPEREIDVLYTPKPTKTVDGDRETFGWDLRWGIGNGGKDGALTYSQATGRLTKTPTPSKGTAQSIELRYTLGPYELIAGARQIPDDYVSIESVGFIRNEKAHNFKLTARPASGWTYGLGQTNSSISSRHVDGNGNTTFTSSRFTTLSAFTKYQPDSGGIPWNLEYNRRRSGSLQGETSIDSWSLNTSKQYGKLDTVLSLQQQSASGPDGEGGRQSAEIFGLNLRTAYEAGRSDRSEVWTVAMNTGFSNVRSKGSNGLGRDILATLQYRKNKDGQLFWGVNFDFQDSDAGGIAALSGFSNGYGAGFNGNGFSGGVGDSSFTSASEVQRYRLRAQYVPSARLALNAYGYTQRSQGSYSSNTLTSGAGIDVSYDLGRQNFVTANLDLSRTRFVDSPLRSVSTTLHVAFDGAPSRLWSYSVIYGLLLSGGSGTFGQNSASVDAAIGYRLAPRQSLALSVRAGNTTGYLAQIESDIGLTYRYQIWKSLALQFAYRVRNVRNSDPFISTGAYSSRGFDIDLVFDFYRS